MLFYEKSLGNVIIRAYDEVSSLWNAFQMKYIHNWKKNVNDLT